MTWASMPSGPMRSRRLSSRSTSLRTASGQLEGLELVSQLLEVFAAAVVAELILDGLELLAQEHLPLAVAELLLDLGLDVLLGVEDRDLALDVDQHGAQPLLHRQGLEQLLCLGRLSSRWPATRSAKRPGSLVSARNCCTASLGMPARRPSSAARSRVSR